MIRVRPVNAIGANKPPCTAKVRVSATDTFASQIAAGARARAGTPRDECGARADFFVDLAPRCRQHAQQAALEHVLAHQETN